MSTELNAVAGRKRVTNGRGVFFVLSLFLACSGAAFASTIYNSIPTPLPGNVPSEGFQSSHVGQFGERIDFAGTDRQVTQVTIIMSDWAKHSDSQAVGDLTGWDWPITFTFYNVDNTQMNPTLNPAPGTVIATKTTTFHIPWRPEPDPTCADPTQWRDATLVCRSGLAFPITFDFSAASVAVPNEIIYGVAFNTETFGAMPTGVPGPDISLNVGLNPVAPSVGSDAAPGSAYQDSDSGSQYGDGGAAGTGFFRQDPNDWAPYTVAADFEAVSAAGVADLSLTKTASTHVATAGANFFYTIVATNNGPDPATGVVVTDPLPAGVTATSTTSTVGSCSGTTTVTCNVGTLANGASATITINAHSSTPGNTSNTATVTADEVDPNGANNAASSGVAIALAQVPASGPLALALLTLLLAAAGLFVTRAR